MITAVCHVAPGYGEVRDMFLAAASNDGYQAQLHAQINGEVVIDCATGLDPDAMLTVFSCSKGMSAFVLALLVDEGKLCLDTEVSHYWPEFAAEGKGAVTVRQLLSHQAGLPQTDEGIVGPEWMNQPRAAARLASQAPLWRPGSAFGYHGVSIGTLMGELCLRLAGRPLQDCYEEWVRKPARADAFLGLPEAHEPRVVELPTFNAHQSGAALAGPYRQAVFSDQSDALYCQTGRAYGHPAVGGVASARGLAAVYQWATGFGGATPGVTRETLRDFAQTQVFGYDVVLDQPLRSHAVVFQKPTAALPFGSHQAFGHDGAGGGMACADPATGLVLGYTVRRAPATAAGAEPEALDYIAAIRRCAAELREGAGIRKDHTS